MKLKIRFFEKETHGRSYFLSICVLLPLFFGINHLWYVLSNDKRGLQEKQYYCGSFVEKTVSSRRGLEYQLYSESNGRFALNADSEIRELPFDYEVRAGDTVCVTYAALFDMTSKGRAILQVTHNGKDLLDEQWRPEYYAENEREANFVLFGFFKLCLLLGFFILISLISINKKGTN